MIAAAVTGFLSGLSLILAIGAQNAFVLRQGLARSHVLPLVLLCAVSDAVLIAAGVAGFGALLALWPDLPRVMALAGAAFLLAYGALRFRAAWRGAGAIVVQGKAPGLGRVLATGAAFTWLNPHVYLDTVGLIGAISTGYDSATLRWTFGAGAITSSFVFFFSLGYGAQLLAPVMSSPRAWRVLDALIGAVMWAIAAGLLLGMG